MAKMQFNGADHQDTAGGAPLPKGRYVMMITESDIKTTKSGNGQYLGITLEVCDQGVNQGRKAWHNMNFACPSSVIAQNIALSHIKRIGEAVGVPSFQDTTQLHNIPMVVTLGLEKDDPNRNAVTGAAFERWDGVAIPAPAATTAAPMAPTAPSPASVAPAAPVAPVQPELPTAPPYAVPPTPPAPPAPPMAPPAG